MLKYLFLLWTILSLFLGYQTTAYDTINFDDYKKQVITVTKSGKSISRDKLIEKFKNIQDQTCIVEKETDLYYLLSPICLLKGDFSSIDPQITLNAVWPSVKGFTIVYNEISKDFSYEGAQPFFDTKNIKTTLPTGLQEMAILAFFQENGVIMRIPLSYLAFDAIKNYSFYTTRKDLTPLKRCTKQNYTVALNSFDGVTLAPGASINLNTHLSYRGGYCKGSGPQDLRFYGGVCGFVTQLFRTSLIVPDIEITKRSPHSVRYVPYYSDYVFGDDAAIYEMSKQFEIKNNSNQTTYFKVLSQNNATYLVSIVPSKPTKGIKISKYETDTLHSTITRETYDLNNKSAVNIQHFYVAYLNKVYTVQ